jgi:cbb3-type cytochrome c oxidase subunit III
MVWKGLVAAAAVLAGTAGVMGTARTDARDARAALAVTVQDTAAGRAIFTGKGLCHACHGPNAKGTPLAPDLTDAKWLNIDGSLENIVKTIKTGVPSPKEHPAPMPPMGGAQLSDAEVQAVARYVFALSHPAK